VVGGEPEPPRVTGPRDRSRETAATGRISGRVVGGDTGRPLRRAQVHISGEGVPQGRGVTTDDDGRFELTDLPAGSYTLMAAKGGYATVMYGQRRPMESPRPIELAAGQRLQGLNLNLPRGAVIAGRVTDDVGEPVANIGVRALRYYRMQGRLMLVPGGFFFNGNSTDDLGRFRIFGLPAGDYYISAGNDAFREQGMVWDANESVVRTYFPGTPSLSDAQRIRVGAGEEVTSVNFAIAAARAATISGTVIDSLGQPVERGHIMMEESGNLMGTGGSGMVENGAFTVRNVSPGTYTLHVNMGDNDREAASVQVNVASEDITGLAIVTSPAAAIVGQVLFESEPLKVVMPGELLFVAVGTGTASLMRSGHFYVKDDWTFEARVHHDGPAVIRAETLPEEWMLKAVLHGGVDVTESGIDFRAGQRIDGVQVVLSNRLSMLTGTVAGRNGKPTQDCSVVVFPDDPRGWGPLSRGLFAVRPSQRGRYEITKLPAGHYLAAAVDYLEDGQHTDPEYLERLRGYATAFEIRDGERRDLNLELVRVQ
jgi:hypothetical protein